VQDSAGLYDGATAIGLIVARDGIHGKWEDAGLKPKPRGVNAAVNLGDWSRMVRSEVIMTDLVSCLGYAKAWPKDADICVYHRADAISPKDELVSTNFPLMSFARPDDDKLKAQLGIVRAYADLRIDRLQEIQTQAGAPIPYLAAIAGVQPSRFPYTHELMGIAQGLATNVVLRVKHALACPRPDAFSYQMQPVIPTPGHATLPSGHATESHCVSMVLAGLLQEQAQNKHYLLRMLLRQSARIAVNRTVAGVHFPADSIAGAALGVVLGKYLVQRSSGDASCLKPIKFDGNGIDANTNFTASWLEGELNPSNPLDLNPLWSGIVEKWPSTTVLSDDQFKSEPLEWLWNKAQAEWCDVQAEDCA